MIPKVKAKRIAIMFFGAGSWGIGMGLFLKSPFILFLSVINLVLGIIFVILYKKK